MLKHIQIQNFRSCLDTTFDLDLGLSAICGRNGVGKSNILKAIEWIAASLITMDRIKLGRSGFASAKQSSIKMRICLDEKVYSYAIDLSVSQSSQRVGLDVVESLSILTKSGASDLLFDRRFDQIHVMHRNESFRVPPFTPALAALASLLPMDDPIRSDVDRITQFLATIRYYSLEDTVGSRNEVTEQVYQDWKNRYESEGESTHSVLLRLVYLKHELPDLFQELLSILGEDGLGLINRIEVTPVDVSTSDEPTKDLGRTKTKFYLLMFGPAKSMGGSGFPFSFSELSSGTRRVLRIITSMLFDKRSLMLIEQPEDSVHPGLLRKLIDLLRTYSNESQILFTTHSPEVMDILRTLVPRSCFL